MQKETRFLLKKLMAIEKSSDAALFSKGQPYGLKQINSQSTDKFQSNQHIADEMECSSAGNYILINHENQGTSSAKSGEQKLGGALLAEHLVVTSGEKGTEYIKEVAEFTIQKCKFQLEKQDEVNASAAQARIQTQMPVLNMKMADFASFGQGSDTRENRELSWHRSKGKRLMLENYQTARDPRTGDSGELTDHYINRRRNSVGIASPAKDPSHNYGVHHENAADVSSDIFSMDPHPISKNLIQPAAVQNGRQLQRDRNLK